MSALLEDFRSIGITVDAGPNDGFVQLPNYKVILGRHAGESVDIALTDVDYPTTPPCGLHIRAAWGSDRPNVGSSGLGADWRYWSRRLTSWKGKRSAHAIIAYINKVLADA